jgi:crossover junction endodeoxyribonuclease RusA
MQTQAGGMIVTLPWPDKRLKPNGSHGHWAVVSKARKLAREAARLLTSDAMQKHLATRAHFEGEHPLPITVTFYPPDRRRRDDDNMVASFKGFRDGIADALGVDDRRFRPHYFFAEPEKPGRVEVSFPRNTQVPVPSERDSAHVNGLPPDEAEAA